MTTGPLAHSITEMNRLRDRAYADAELERRQALQDFWRGADSLLQTAASGIERSAMRFANRLGRHMAKPATTQNKSCPSN